MSVAQCLDILTTSHWRTAWTTQKNMFNKGLGMWNFCRGRSGGFVGESSWSRNMHDWIHIYISLYIYFLWGAKSGVYIYICACACIYIYTQMYKHSKGTLFNSPNGFQFLPIFAEGSLLKAHESTREGLWVWENKLRHDITLQGAMAQLSHYILNNCTVNSKYIC